MKRRIVAALGLLGIVAVFAEGGFNVQSHSGIISISLPPAILFYWVIFLLVAASTELSENAPTNTVAPWWRKATAFLFDFYAFLCVLFIPLTFLALVLQLGSLPPPWFVEDQPVSNTPLSTSLFFISFCLLWAGMGLALHPRVRTPGMILMNIDLRVEDSESLGKLAVFGLFAYYGVFIPFFAWFSNGMKVHGMYAAPNK